MRYASAILLAAMLAAPVFAADEKAPFPSFAFGAEQSPTLAGFTKVTHLTKYDDAAGFGWLDTKGLESVNRGTPATLEQTFVKGAGTFAVKLPNGKYHVWMLMNDSGGLMSFPRFTERTIKVGGKVVYEKKMTHDDFLKNFYANLDVEDLPGEDVFMLYVESRWWPVEFDAEAAGGRLEIAISGDGDGPLVNALVVYPLDKKAEGDQWLADVREKRRADFYAKHAELPVPEPAVEPFPNEKEKDRGYIVFQRAISAPVYPTSSPKGGGAEIDRIDVTIAHGQFLAIPICVFPFQDLGNVKVTADVALPYDRARNAMRVGYVEYKIRRVDPNGTKYQVRPALIRNKDAVRIDKGVTRQFWLTLEMPEGFPARTYEGQIVITPEHGGKLTVPMTVRVLDFALPEAKDIVFWPAGTETDLEDFWKRLDGPGDAGKQEIARSLDNIRNHGLSDDIRNAGRQLPAERFSWGAFAYALPKDKAEGRFFWTSDRWMRFSGDPFFDLDGGFPDNGLVFPSPEGDMNTPRFEVLREGITDFRYLWALDKFPEGEAFLKDIREKAAADAKANKPWSDATLDAMRAKAAELISKHVAAGEKAP